MLQQPPFTLLSLIPLQWWIVVPWMIYLMEQSALHRALCTELQQATHVTLATGYLGMTQGSAGQMGGGVGHHQYAKVADACSWCNRYLCTSLQYPDHLMLWFIVL